MMNRKQTKTLITVFEKPTRSDIPWREIESLLLALGAVLQEGRGSRVRFTLNNTVALFHRPHPERIAGRCLVRDVGDFLRNAGVEEP